MSALLLRKKKNNKSEGERTDGVFPSPNTLILSCFLLYVGMMAAKGVYVAEITYIMEIFSVDKTTASLANTFYFLTYASVQIALFFCVKYIDLRKFNIMLVPFAAIATILMGFSENIYHMWILFAICGLFQAGVYCGCNHVLTRYLPPKYHSRANTVMNFGYAVGTGIAYGVSATSVKFENWRFPFFLLGSLFLLSVGFFAVCVMRARPAIETVRASELVADKTHHHDDSPLFSVKTAKDKILFYTVDLIIVFFITALYYAVLNWISALLVGEYGMNQDVSMYITLLAPITVAIGPVFTIRACDKDRNFVRVGIKYTLAILPIPLLLAFFYKSNVIFAIVMSILFVVLVNGVKSVVLGIMAFKLRNVIDTAQYSAASNSVASISAGVAPTIVGKIIDGYGWSASYMVIFFVTLMILLAAIVINLCISGRGREKKDAEASIS